MPAEGPQVFSPPALSRRRFAALSAAALGAFSHHPLSPAWAEEPPPLDLLVRSESPFNAEPELADLIAAETTPLAHFYVRNHGPVPKVEADAYRLSVEGLVHRPRTWKLAEVQRDFERQTVEATLTCAGNRRREMSAERPIGGIAWDAGAIGHARWEGAALADLLAAAEPRAGAKHVWFEGLDPITEKDGSVAPFGGSVPLSRALTPADKSPLALVAYRMNDRPLSPQHGFPLRTVVPGYIGARSVKWLTKIIVSDRPSPNHYVAEAYKLTTSADPAELAAAEPIYEFPINSAICLPAAGAKVAAGKVRIAGYALPSGEAGASVSRVELSVDGGRTWSQVELLGDARPACWRLWRTEIELAAGKHALLARATDTAGHTQPATTPWNAKGYLHNAWHRVEVECG
ncbi:MAG: molybdopterin-dependent oxidoreductase [Pirellulaceae bacterium]|nr:molybdopterin-dependent oxidoreductase [Pirellulaceae bacterium]